MQFSPILPTQPFQPGSAVPQGPIDISTIDSATVYIHITVSSDEVYDPGCLILGEGDAQLRWTAADDQLRWLAADADLRWEASFRLGTGQC